MGVFVPQVPDNPFPIFGTGAWRYIRDQFDKSMEYADISFDNTQEYIKILAQFLKELEVPVTGDIDVELPDIPRFDYDERPDMNDLELNPDWPSAPDAPVLDEVPDISDVEIPTMSFSPPDYNMPESPVLNEPQPPGDVPQINMPDVPQAPSVSLPDPPTLEEIAIPSPPSITIPEFEATIPNIELEPPGEFNWQENPYNSDVWCSLLDNVLHGLQNGGTGLDPEVEQEIWERAIRRQNIEDDATMRKIRDTYSARGYDMPPGALAGAEIEAYRNADLNKQNINSDIAIKQAELAQANTQFIIDKGVQLEQILRGFHDSQANRSFEAAKMVFQAGVELLNSRVAIANMHIEKYKSEAMVYESRVKAALTTVEIYKAQVEGARVSAQVQQIMVDAYGKQIEAVNTYVKMYATQMEAAKIASDIERNKLEIYNLETQAYIAKMNAEKVKFDVFSTQVEAEKAKAQMYSEQVRAFVAEVEAAKSKLEAENIKLEAVLKSNGMLIDKYRGELAGYTAEIDAIGKELTAQVDGFRAEVAAYSAETDMQTAIYNVKIKEIDANIEAARFNLQKAIAEIDASTKGYVAVKELQSKGTEGIMNVSAQLAASALTAVNTSASIQDSSNKSQSKRYSHSMSLGETHPYEPIAS